VFEKNVQVDAGWVPVQISLAEWKNQPVVITFLTIHSRGSIRLAAWLSPVSRPTVIRRHPKSRLAMNDEEEGRMQNGE